MNYLVSYDMSFANCGVIAAGLRRLGAWESVYYQKSDRGYEIHDEKAKFGIKNLPDSGERLVLVSGFMYDVIEDKKGRAWFDRFEKKVIILSDTRSVQFPERYIEAFKEGWKVFCMPSNLQFIEGIEMYQPETVDMNATKVIDVCHAPFSDNKKGHKGTDHIINVCEQLGVKLDLIMGVPWYECIQRKSRAKIFIDQIASPSLRDDYKGGIGKNGLESMRLHSMVISRGKYHGRDIPTPPIVWAEKETLKKTLDHYLHNDIEREGIVQEQYEWAKRFTDPQFVAQRIIKTLWKE